MHILVVGAHPDDPEDGCGGAILKLVARGHRVTVLYLTRGEAGIPGKAAAEAAVIRTREARTACAALGATPLFFDQIDAQCVVNADTRERFAALAAAQQPDVIFAHWPIDTHRDHQVSSLLSFEAWRRIADTCDLVYFEVMYGGQSMHFYPTRYVDISNVSARKFDICRMHASQDTDGWRERYHGPMEHFRGMACGADRAEAYIACDANRADKLTALNLFR